MLVHNIWQGQSCQVADKCIDVTSTIFINKATTLSLYHKCFINNNITNKIKCMYWFNYKIVIGSQKKQTNKKQLNVKDVLDE